jgi:hypothetical protein
MAINKNHEFEEVAGIKCAIVEKNVLKERADFLKFILEFNKYTVVVAPAAPPKAKAPAAANDIPETTDPLPVPEEKFTVGVTDLMFNPVNAVFGRFLRTPEGNVVTLAYWEQKEEQAHDRIPYYENKAL